MLSNDINAVCKKMKNISDAKRNEHIQKEQEKRNTAFFDSYSTFKTVLNSVIIGNEKVGFVISKETRDEINSLLEDIKAIFEKKQVSNPYEISKRIKDLEYIIKEEWDRCAREKLGIKSNIELLKLISDNKYLGGLNFELNAIREWPVTETSIARYNRAYERASEAIKEYNFSDGVRNFLTKIQNKNATFRDLTDEVQEWIIDENLEDRIGLIIVHKN